MLRTCRWWFYCIWLGPQPDWDPDIVETLDDDYEHCDSLEDDFMDMANASPSDGSHDNGLTE